MNRIKKLRNEKNINQDVLAKLLGLEIAGISKLETGRVPLKDEYIIKLAEYFDVSTDYLLGKSDIRNPEEFNNDDLHIALSKEDKGVISDELKNKITEYAKFVIEQEKNKKDE